MRELHPAERALGYTFRDPALLEQALTHSSYANENDVADNERLEFLGDAVLQLCTTVLLVRAHPDEREGQLSWWRQRLVDQPALARLAQELGLGPSLRLGIGEESSGGREKPSVLSCATEAVLGAVYEDGGFDACLQVVERLVGAAVEDLADGHGDGKNPRSRLQEAVQAEHGQTPTYRITGHEGPAHERTYDAVVEVGDRLLGHGRGGSKKEAFKRAAEDALRLREEAS